MDILKKNKSKAITQIGGKAYNLNILEKNKINVPKWFCVIEEKEEEILDYLESNFKDEDVFSIRSSNSLEDGQTLSYAGQFETLLFVEKSNVISSLEKVRKASKEANTLDYDKQNKSIKNGKIKPCSIVQKMIDATKSGVMFTQNPSGILNEMVIVCGKGVGENVVEDKVPTSTYYYNKTDQIGYFQKQENAEILLESEKEELIKIGLEIEKIYNKAMDIEWCIKENIIYILQARPITTFSKNENKIILDNSNIIESYPGVTLPLSIDFVKDMYYRIFKNLILRVTSKDKVVEGYEEVFKNMVDSANGRMYYRISNWYFVLSFLPMKDKIIKIWQEMLGVTTKKVTIDKSLKISSKVKFKIIKNGLNLFKNNKENMQDLENHYLKIKNEIEIELKNSNTNTKLIYLYKKLIDIVMEKWDYTLINDLYAFIYTSLAKKELKKLNKGILDGDINRYISQIKNLESMKPIKELINIVTYLKENNLEETILNINSIDKYNEYIKQDTELAKRILEYIEVYGDRSLEELKLESKTFRTNPLLLIKKINDFTKDENLKDIIRENELEDPIEIKENKKSKKYKSKATIGISYREQSRLNRCRLYAMARSIMLEIGKNLKEENKILEKEDIFYLNLKELFNLKDADNKDYKEEVEYKKKINIINKSLPQYSRLIYDTKVVEKFPLNINEIETTFSNKILRGIPSSSGIVRGEVVLIENVSKDYDISGKILVTRLTDPGWVFLISRAAGIISEKGSILSHTAIISRELKKPAVVGVKNVMKILKNGDIVELDAEKGTITLID